MTEKKPRYQAQKRRGKGKPKLSTIHKTVPVCFVTTENVTKKIQKAIRNLKRKDINIKKSELYRVLLEMTADNADQIYLSWLYQKQEDLLKEERARLDLGPLQELDQE